MTSRLCQHGDELQQQIDFEPLLACLRAVCHRRMSGMGHLQTFGEPDRMFALPPKADIKVTHRHVYFGPIADFVRRSKVALLFDQPVGKCAQ
jgi:hypothetical protein